MKTGNQVVLTSGDLYKSALEVMHKAYVPYSNFAVGAAILACDGQIYCGCNVENVSYPLGVCAEESAISAMVGSAGAASTIREILIVSSSDLIIVPCGGCRQRLLEFATDETVVISCDKDGNSKRFLLQDLLPYAFLKQHMGLE